MDWILVSLLALFAVGGTFRGFVRSAFSLLTFSLTLIVAFSLTLPVSNFLIDKNVLFHPISSAVGSVVSGLDEQIGQLEFTDKNEMVQFVERSNIPLYAKSILSGIVAKSEFSGSFTVSQVVSRPLYSAGIKIISFMFLALFIYIIFRIIQIFVVKLLRFPFLKVTDRVLGFIFGMIMGIIVYLFIVCVMLAVSQFVLSEWIIKKIEGGYLSSIFYEKFGNLILAKLNLIL